MLINYVWACREELFKLKSARESQRISESDRSSNNSVNAPNQQSFTMLLENFFELFEPWRTLRERMQISSILIFKGQEN